MSGFSANYLDVTVTINNGRITSSIYEKPLNLHLYITSNSSHAPGTLKSLIFGAFRRAITLSTFPEDRARYLGQLSYHLRQRGHSPRRISRLYKQAQQKYDIHAERQGYSQPTIAKTTSPSLYLHLAYHHEDPKRQNIQRAFKRLVREPPGHRPMASLPHRRTSAQFGIDKLTIA